MKDRSIWKHFYLLPALLAFVLCGTLAGAKEEAVPGSPFPPAPVGQGDGLLGTYYNTTDLSGPPALQRVDPTIDFDWGDTSPGPGVNKDGSSIRWTGQIQPQFTETYTFTTLTDDGVRLWVNGHKILEDWTDHPPKENSGTIALEAGKKYDILIEYFELHIIAVAKLMWSSDSTPHQVVPQSQLYSSAGNRPPLAASQTYAVTKDQPFSFTLNAVDFDGDPLTYTVTTPPAKGTLSGSSPQLTYTPNAGVTGTDSLSFKASDGSHDSNAATVTFHINEAGTGNGLNAAYFDNRELVGEPVLRRVDPAIDFDWRNGSPDPSVPADNFSARWTG